MNFGECIQNAATVGKISQEKADEASAIYEHEMENQLAQGVHPDQADQLAGMEALKRATNLTTEKRLMRYAEMRKMSEILDTFQKSKDPAAEIHRTIAKVDFTQRSLEGQVASFLSDLLLAHEPQLGGFKLPLDNSNDLVDAAFGEGGSDTAKSMIEAVHGGIQFLREQFAHVGITLPDNPKFRIPQALDRIKFRDTSWEEFKDFYLNKVKLDWETMKYGGQDISEADREKVLAVAFHNIKTDNAPDVSELAQNIAKSYAPQKSFDRFFYFADAKSWKLANEQFGRGTAYEQIMGMFHSLEKDLSLAHTFGPNPEAGKNFLVKAAKMKAGELDKAGAPKGQLRVEKVKDATRRLEESLDIFKSSVLNGDENKVAQIGNVVRAIAIAPKLGATLLSAVFTDPGLLANAGSVLFGFTKEGIIGEQLKGLFAMNKAEALKNTLPIPSVVHSASQEMRWGLIDAPNWARRAGDMAMRTSWGFATHNASVRTGGYIFMRNIADVADKAFEDLHPDLQRTFTQHGISPSDWNYLREVPKADLTGEGYMGLRPMDASARATNYTEATAASNLGYMMHDFISKGNPSPGLETQVLMGRNISPNEMKGQWMRAAGALHSFPVEMLINQVGGIFRDADPSDKMRLAAKIFLYQTALGALTLQVKALAQGKDMRNMDPTHGEGLGFWTEAVASGGGATIIYDYLHTLGQQIFEKKPIASDGSIVGSDLADVVKTGHDAIYHQGQLPSDLVKTAGDVVPVPWNIKYLWSLTLRDEIMKLADPAGYDRLQASQAKHEAETGQGYYVPAGGPVRAPRYAQAPE